MAESVAIAFCYYYACMHVSVLREPIWTCPDLGLISAAYRLTDFLVGQLDLLEAECIPLHFCGWLAN